MKELCFLYCKCIHVGNFAVKLLFLEFRLFPSYVFYWQSALSQIAFVSTIRRTSLLRCSLLSHIMSSSLKSQNVLCSSKEYTHTSLRRKKYQSRYSEYCMPATGMCFIAHNRNFSENWLIPGKVGCSSLGVVSYHEFVTVCRYHIIVLMSLLCSSNFLAQCPLALDFVLP